MNWANVEGVSITWVSIDEKKCETQRVFIGAEDNECIGKILHFDKAVLKIEKVLDLD